MAICEKCKGEVSDDARFCPNCGAQLTDEEPFEESEDNSEGAVDEDDEDVSQYEDEDEYEDEEEEEKSHNYWVWGLIVVIATVIWGYYKRQARKEMVKEMAIEKFREKHHKADVIVPNLFD